MATDTITTELTQIIHVLTNCSTICRSVITSPELNIAQDHDLPEISKLTRMVNDCAASCDIAVLLIERKSNIIIDFLELCEELTMECAWECSKYGFEVCRQTAEACEQVAKACLPFIIHKKSV